VSPRRHVIGRAGAASWAPGGAMTVRLPEATQDALSEAAQSQRRVVHALVVRPSSSTSPTRTGRRDEGLARIVTQEVAILDRLA
jgi:hypothetical protein